MNEYNYEQEAWEQGRSNTPAQPTGKPSDMRLNEYQAMAMTTCMPSSANFSYMLLNLIGEVGEFSEKALSAQMPYELRKVLKDMVEIGAEAGRIAKLVRKIPDHELQHFRPAFSDTMLTELQKEAGDIEWQHSGLCTVMGWQLGDIAQQNLDKLASRQQRNVIDGNGDNR